MLFDPKATKTFEIPGEEHSVTVRPLPHVELQACRDAAQTKSLQMMQAMGGDIVGAIMKSQTKVDGRQRAQFSECDEGELVRKGLKGWTYPEPVSPEVIARLDGDTHRFIAECVWNVSRPQSAAEKLGNSSSS